MAGYIAIFGDTEPPQARVVLDLLQTSVSRQGAWRWWLQDRHRRVLVHGAQRSVEIPEAGGLIFGDLWSAEGRALTASDLTAPLNASTQEHARHLLATAWGRYVAILGDPSAPTILRDPSGGLEAFTWRHGELRIVASHIPFDLLGSLAPSIELDWDQVAGYLADPVSLSGPLALGVCALQAGAVMQIDGERETSSEAWAPSMFTSETGLSLPQIEGRFVQLVDLVVGSWAHARSRVLAEVSGGLDSAIVAAALARTAEPNVVQWLNHYGAGAEGDERSFALALGELYGVQITCAPAPSRPMDLAGVMANAAGMRPSLLGLDYLRDEEMAARCEVLNAEAIFTGQGGDAVFLQRLTPLALADRVRREGVSSLRPASLQALADWTGLSAWSVLRQALKGVRSEARPGAAAPPSFAGQRLREISPELHPWLANLEGVAPGKRQQIERLVQSQLVAGDCQRTRAADLIHPLLAQPVVELSLSTPTDLLTGLQRDRALVRRAFRSRLPEVLLQRRTKGDMTAHYGRWVCDSLPFLRPFLLEGSLAREDILDRAKLAALLSPEQLIWGADYVAILFAAQLEAWVRHWEGRRR